jgi:archaemetzincin
LEKHGIQLISYGIFDRGFLDRITSGVRVEYGLPARLAISHSDLASFYDPARRQYDGNKLLRKLESENDRESIKTIGLFKVDLFIPILTYIFGQAAYRGKSGIASLYRLKNELYGLPKDDSLMSERFLKVVIHELGHTYGLVHCHIPSCVMRPGTYIEDLDQKKPHLCPHCREEFEKYLNEHS